MAELSAVSGYEVLELVGEGPLFAVYRARDTRSGRVVAIKQITPERSADTLFLQGLQKGLAKAQPLSHPNITTLYTLGLQSSPPFFTCEFVRGANLKERIHRIAPFTTPVAVDIACTIADALRVAHALGLPHGDLRPQNIIVTPEGAVKIIDFGVAEGIAASPSAQQALLMARAPYHAPELSVTKPGTPAADIYALGAILYEMLTGAPVYTAETAQAIADLHAFATIPSPRMVNASVPRPLEGITLKCLQKRPEQRYASATDLLNDLKEVRDALRFGKPLSWSLADIENLSTDPPRRPQPNSASADKASPTPNTETSPGGRPTVMPSSTNRLRAREERVSSFLVGAIGFVTFAIIFLLVAFYAIYHTYWVAPPPEHVPNLVGMDVDQAQQLASKLHLRLLLHGDYMDRPRNIIYKTDLAPGEEIRPGHYINVWYSKGPTYVNVPNVTGLPRQQAEQVLQSAGLKVGQITLVYSNTVPQDVVVSQDVSYKKRVLHDTAVDLTVSDGPQPDYAQPAAPSASGSTGESNSSTSSNTDTTVPGDLQTHEFRSTIVLRPTPTSGPGPWGVRISYTDASGIPMDVIDEQHSAGDTVPIDFTYQGSQFVLRIYYNDQLVYQHVYHASSASSDNSNNPGGNSTP